LFPQISKIQISTLKTKQSPLTGFEKSEWNLRPRVTLHSPQAFWLPFRVTVAGLLRIHTVFPLGDAISSADNYSTVLKFHNLLP